MLIADDGVILSGSGESRPIVCALVNWTTGKKLGSGGFGQVYKCHDRNSGKDLAVKVVRCQPGKAFKVYCAVF